MGPWDLLAVFLLAWTVLEMVNHGGGTIPLGMVGFIAPDLALFVGPAGPHESGQLPRGKVAAYSLVHRPIGPVLGLVGVPRAVGVAPRPPGPRPAGTARLYRPFAGCTKGEHQIDHRLPGLVPSAWRLAED
ncbi:hypothetical protein [Streptomyces sp. NPDC001020]